MASIRIWSDEKMGNYDNNGSWGRRDKEAVRLNRKRDGLLVARNRFVTCLMEVVCVIHDVIDQLQPGNNVRIQALAGEDVSDEH